MTRISFIFLSALLAGLWFGTADFSSASSHPDTIPAPVQTESSDSSTQTLRAAAGQKIILSESALRHIRRRHFPKGPESAGKSTFFPQIDVPALIRDAEKAPPERERFGSRLKRTVEAPRPVGIDRTTGRPTRLYTVITSEQGTLITAFPGVSGRPKVWRYTYPRPPEKSDLPAPAQP